MIKSVIRLAIKNRSGTVWKYYFFQFLSGFLFFSAVLVPMLTLWGKLALWQVQFLQSWFMLCIFLAEVPTGAVADFFGRKYSLILGGFVTSVAFLIYGLFPRFEVFLLGETLAAIGAALASGADDALLYDALKEAGRENESKKIFSRAHLISLLGIATAAPIGSLIYAKLGINAPMLLSAIPPFLSGFVAWTIVEPAVQSKKSEVKRYWIIIREGFTYFLRHKNLRPLVFDAIAVASAAYFVIWLYQPTLEKIGFPIGAFGFVQAMLVGSEMIIAGSFVVLEKIVGGPKRYFKLTALLTGIAFLVTAAFPSVISVFAFLIIAGGFGLTRLELMNSYINKLIESENRATVLSSISMFRRLALVALNPIVGIVADRSLPGAFVLVGIIPLVVFILSPIEERMLKN